MKRVQTGHHEINEKENANFVLKFSLANFAVAKVSDFFVACQIISLLRLHDKRGILPQKITAHINVFFAVSVVVAERGV